MKYKAGDLSNMDTGIVKEFVSMQYKPLTKAKMCVQTFSLAIGFVLINLLYMQLHIQERLLPVSIYVLGVGVILTTCITIILMIKGKLPKNDYLYKCVLYITVAITLLAITVKLQTRLLHIEPVIILPFLIFAALSVPITTIVEIRQKLLKRKSIDYNSEPLSTLATVATWGRLAIVGIPILYFTGSSISALVASVMVLVLSRLLEIGSRYGYKVFLIEKYCPDIIIPETQGFTDKLEDGKND
jgi:hypothetical protein